MKRTRFAPPPMVGGCSLLVIFAVLALSVFSLLTLSTALAEERLSNASAQAVSAYYQADREAEQIYARLRSGEAVPQVQQNGAVYRYTCPISQQQLLLVELECTDGVWRVLRWQAVVLPDGADSETVLNVWDGKVP